MVRKKVCLSINFGQYRELATFPFAVLDQFSYYVHWGLVGFFGLGLFFFQLHNTKIHNFALIPIGASLH